MRLTLTLPLNPSHWVHHLPQISSFTIPISNTQNKNLTGLSLPGHSDPLQWHCHGENLNDSQLVSSLSLQPKCQALITILTSAQASQAFPPTVLSPIHSMPPHQRNSYQMQIRSCHNPVQGLGMNCPHSPENLTKFLSMTMRPSMPQYRAVISSFIFHLLPPHSPQLLMNSAALAEHFRLTLSSSLRRFPGLECAPSSTSQGPEEHPSRTLPWPFPLLS